jgi:hypothetical protein
MLGTGFGLWLKTDLAEILKSNHPESIGVTLAGVSPALSRHKKAVVERRDAPFWPSRKTAYGIWCPASSS